MDLSKPIWQLTVGQFIDLINSNDSNEFNKSTKSIVTGYKGLADFLGCSKAKVAGMIASGMLDEAKIQNGRLIIFDTDKVLEILKNEENY